MTITMHAEAGLVLGQIRKRSASDCELVLDLRKVQLNPLRLFKNFSAI